MANEAVDFWRANKRKSFVIKLNLEKGFDKIGWSFIDYMLKVKNYPSIWRLVFYLDQW